MDFLTDFLKVPRSRRPAALRPKKVSINELAQARRH